jgi:hypothetical protein
MGVCCAILIALGLTILSPGFSNLRTSVKDLDGRATGFKGIGQLYGDPSQTGQLLGARTSTVKLLAVHGIGDHDIGWSKEMSDALGQRLHLDFASETPPEDLDATGLPPKVKPAKLVRRLYQSAERKLAVFEVTWSPLVADLKGPLVEFEMQHRGERALINRYIKEEIINQRFADAVIYLGDRKLLLRRAVKQTICKMLQSELEGEPGHETCANPRLEEEATIAVVTESLGSKIAFDSLEELRDDEKRAGRITSSAYVFLGATSSFFMLAQQLPLLALASPPAPPGGPAIAPESRPGTIGSTIVQQSSLYKALTLHREIPASQRRHRLEVVNVSDPNDLLSYPLPPDFQPAFPDVRFVNVTKLIAHRFLSGALADPQQAHTGHVKDRKVMRMMVDGVPAPPQRPLK